MPIKNKITQKIKTAFKEELEKTRHDNNERGFLLCLKNDKLILPKKRCKGKGCEFNIKDLKKYCPDKTQGAFHTHPYFYLVKEFYKHDPTHKELEFAKKTYERSWARSGITLQTPSHQDVVDTLRSYCTDNMEGTVCVGNDLDLEKVECWTVIKDKVRFKDCSQAVIEVKERSNKAPRGWVRELFEKEVIDIKG